MIFGIYAVAAMRSPPLQIMKPIGHLDKVMPANIALDSQLVHQMLSIRRAHQQRINVTG